MHGATNATWLGFGVYNRSDSYAVCCQSGERARPDLKEGEKCERVQQVNRITGELCRMVALMVTGCKLEEENISDYKIITITAQALAACFVAFCIKKSIQNSLKVQFLFFIFIFSLKFYLT